MAKESIRQVHQAARDFAARDEAASQTAIMPKVIKPSRVVPTSKRTASDVIKQESRFFEDDDLARASRLPLSKGFLPLVDTVGKKFGLTNLTPDVIYGLKYPTALGTGPAKLSDAARAAIGLVTGVRHAFFLNECKGDTDCRLTDEKCLRLNLEEGSRDLCAKHDMTKLMCRLFGGRNSLSRRNCCRSVGSFAKDSLCQWIAFRHRVSRR